MRSRSLVERALAGSGEGARPLPDILAAVLVVGMFWLPSTLAVADRSRLVAGLALASVTGGAMILRRRFPAGSTVIAGIATVAGSLLGVCQDPLLATAWCLYPLAIAHAARTRALVLFLLCLLAGLAAVTGVPAGDASEAGQRLVLAVAALSVAWLLGTATGRQIAAAREAERARVQLEVARDVHDVVGHALGVISAEAGVTRALPDAGEQELRDSLADVEAHARRALEEVQAFVRALRSAPGSPAGAGPGPGPGGTAAGPAGARPGGAVAGIARLPSVVAATRAAGVGVEARIEVNGYVDDVVGAVVFRIVQESLSNVVRHAPGAGCAVDVREDGETIVVSVRDHGPGARANGGSGFGLRGMRERARLVGGTVTWGNHPDGGFDVTARLPAGGAR
ncbi:sensor histidine kinase [Streptosporangium sp. OZ121]|uniref:sensor histidine kinase n=1 Tax=Streptosporangium sp. OZ121 TaxID=3444183 RepID=UPI003F795858